VTDKGLRGYGTGFLRDMESGMHRRTDVELERPYRIEVPFC
jgi:hypothetical protein